MEAHPGIPVIMSRDGVDSVLPDIIRKIRSLRGKTMHETYVQCSLRTIIAVLGAGHLLRETG